jgi:hypothetical protein
MRRKEEQDTKIHPKMARIFEMLFQGDVARDFASLTEGLSIGKDRSNRGTLIVALDEAETNQRRAHQLLCNARLLANDFDKRSSGMRAAMRRAATLELQMEKKAGHRSKAITDADVQGRCVELYGDEFNKLERDRIKHKQTIEHIEDLVKAWRSRCRTLQVMATLIR